MLTFDFKGIIATAFTPFNDDEERSLNLPVIRDTARKFRDQSFTCVLINGTYGEGMAMTVEERIQVAEEWAKIIKETKQKLVIQVGGTNLKDVKKLAKHAQSVKAAGLLCLPELYYKPKTVEELIEYLKEVGQAAPETPLFYYHSPLATGVALPMEELFDKVIGRVPSFAGIKFASPNIDELSRVIRCDESANYKIIVASNHNLPLYIQMGIDTFMPTAVNFYSSLVKTIYTSALNEDHKQAQHGQEILSKAVDMIAALNNGNAAPPMKALVGQCLRIHVGPPRKPLPSFETPEERKQISRLLNNLDI